MSKQNERMMIDAEMERLRTFAERYRWLRSHFRFANDSMHEIWFDTKLNLKEGESEELDTVIDGIRTKDLEI